MTVALVQSATGVGSGFPPALPAAPTPGNLVILQHADLAAPSPTGFTDAFGAFLDLAAASNGFRLWYRIAQAGDPAVLAGTFGTNHWIVAEFSGVQPTGPITASGVARQASSTHPHHAIAPAYAGEVLIVAPIIHANTLMGPNFVPDAGYTVLHKYDYSGQPNVAGLLYLVDPDNAGAYDPGVSTAPFTGAWAAGALAWAGAVLVPTVPDPYEAPAPARAILEIYVSDPAGDRWDAGLWGTATWGTAGWQSITPWSVIADVTWGADRAEAGILADQVAGSWVVETHDPDRVLDPSNADSPFYPDIVPGTPIRLLHHSRIIRQGQLTRAWYSHADRGGRLSASDAISELANAKVPADTSLSDTLRLRSIEAIAAAGLEIIAWPALAPDPDVSPAEAGEFSVWAVITTAAREVLYVPWANNGNRLTFRPWSAPLDRGRVIAAPLLVDVAAWTGDEGLYSVVRAQEPGGAMEERRATPLPRYGARVYERTEDTIDAGIWADTVLADRRDASLRYVPGDIRPDTDADVAWLARLELMEDVVLSLPSADPPVLVTARILGMRVRAVDETVRPGVIRTRWRWRLIATVVPTSPLIVDQSTSGEYLYADQDPTQPLYPDGA